VTGEGGSVRRRLAYVVLLGTSTMGTLSSNIANAALHSIAEDLGTSSSEVVLVVSAFTIAMVVFAPLAGWLCDRWGARRFLIASLALMVVAQVGAALSPGLGVLVAMRVGQGIACSAIPPAVQLMLNRGWPASRARVMGAWASAIGVGQAIGPPLGGAVAGLWGWRAVFLAYAVLCVAFVACVVLVVPPAPARRVGLHVAGTASLAAGVGSLVTGLTVAAQGWSAPLAGALLALGSLSLALAWRAAHQSPAAFLDPVLLREPRYLRSTVSAGVVMAVLGIVIVTVPLQLGRGAGLAPGPIGGTMFVLALSMAVFAPVSSRIGERVTARRVLHAGLAALVLGLPVLGWAAPLASGRWGLAPLAVALVLVGCGIGAVQSTAAFALARSPAAALGTALGLHNTVRFAGLAVGYAWAAATFPRAGLWLVFGGGSVMALGALLMVSGPPAPPVTEHPARAG
jgi:MFS family permease